jgi:periplasmic divalent cation tolerance protein
MRVVLCNAPADKAPEIARALIERHKAACVNLLPGVRSFYRWEGKVCEDAEVTMLIKVAATGVLDLRDTLLELHPYQLPEIVVLPVDAETTHRPYVDWVRKESHPLTEE